MYKICSAAFKFMINHSNNKNLYVSYLTTNSIGSECCRFYTLDWGGTNYRVLRIDFLGGENGCLLHQFFIHGIVDGNDNNNESVLVLTILAIWNDIDINNIEGKCLRYHCPIDTSNWTMNDFNLFVEICNTITFRSAGVSAAMLAAVLEKPGLFYDDRNIINGRLKLSNEYFNNRNTYITVGIEGNVTFCDSININT